MTHTYKTQSLYPCKGSLLFNLRSRTKNIYGQHKKQSSRLNVCGPYPKSSISLNREFFERPVLYFHFDIYENQGFQTITYLSDDEDI